jgi:uncharacterized protein YjbI with pentapeptide repeats
VKENKMTQHALLSLLHQGVEIWNQQRPRVRGGPLPTTYWGFYPDDFDEVDYARSLVDLSGVDLSGTDLPQVDLSHSKLKGTTLRTANLSRADLSHVTMWRADLSGANLRGANFSLTNLTEANLENADLREANLYWTSLHGVNLRGADLRRTHLCETMFNRADLRGADLREADISTANLTLCQLQEVRSLDLAALREKWRVCTEKEVLIWLGRGDEMVWRQLRWAEQLFGQADLDALRELIERKAPGSWERYRLRSQEQA